MQCERKIINVYQRFLQQEAHAFLNQVHCNELLDSLDFYIHEKLG